jgi:hypothetical protein
MDTCGGIRGKKKVHFADDLCQLTLSKPGISKNKHLPRGAEEHIFQEHPHSSGITLLIMFFMSGYVLGSRVNRHPHWCLYLSVGGLLIAILYPKC